MLIITCPCGFAIAVPAVQAVAVGALFRRGVLVARGTALERLASADHAVLDKTGTLTEGRPTLLPGGWTDRSCARPPAWRARAATRWPAPWPRLPGCAAGAGRRGGAGPWPGGRRSTGWAAPASAAASAGRMPG